MGASLFLTNLRHLPWRCWMWWNFVRHCAGSRARDNPVAERTKSRRPGTWPRWWFVRLGFWMVFLVFSTDWLKEQLTSPGWSACLLMEHGGFWCHVFLHPQSNECFWESFWAKIWEYLNQSSTELPICAFEAFFGHKDRGFTMLYLLREINITKQDPKQQPKFYTCVFTHREMSQLYPRSEYGYWIVAFWFRATFFVFPGRCSRLFLIAPVTGVTVSVVNARSTFHRGSRPGRRDSCGDCSCGGRGDTSGGPTRIWAKDGSVSHDFTASVSSRKTSLQHTPSLSSGMNTSCQLDCKQTLPTPHLPSLSTFNRTSPRVTQVSTCKITANSPEIPKPGQVGFNQISVSPIWWLSHPHGPHGCQIAWDHPLKICPVQSCLIPNSPHGTSQPAVWLQSWWTNQIIPNRNVTKRYRIIQTTTSGWWLIFKA